MSLAQARKQEEEKEEKKRKLISGFITFGFLAALTALLIIFGFSYPDPLPPETGAVVSLGEPDGGTWIIKTTITIAHICIHPVSIKP